MSIIIDWTVNIGQHNPEYSSHMGSNAPIVRIYYIIRLSIGVILIPIGLVITLLPIPIGLILIFIGITLIAYDSRYLKNQIFKLRKRYPKLSEKLQKLEPHSFFLLRDVLKKTDPSRMDK